MIFNDFIKYLKDNPKGYWFKRKLFGWGWIPVVWQGTLVTGLYIAIVVFVGTQLSPEPTLSEVFAFNVPIVFATIVFIGIAYKKGENPKWQWGLKKENINK